MEAFNKILKASEKIKPRDLLNAQNFANEVSTIATGWSSTILSTTYEV